jgi:hypothetical protein
MHGKDQKLHGKGIAVRQRTAKIRRQRLRRQRIFAVRFGNYARQRPFAMHVFFAVRGSPVP